jgi:hypothetical protein
MSSPITCALCHLQRGLSSASGGIIQGNTWYCGAACQLVAAHTSKIIGVEGGNGPPATSSESSTGSKRKRQNPKKGKNRGDGTDGDEQVLEDENALFPPEIKFDFNSFRATMKLGDLQIGFNGKRRETNDTDILIRKEFILFRKKVLDNVDDANNWELIDVVEEGIEGFFKIIARLKKIYDAFSNLVGDFPYKPHFDLNDYVKNKLKWFEHERESLRNFRYWYKDDAIKQLWRYTTRPIYYLFNKLVKDSKEDINDIRLVEDEDWVVEQKRTLEQERQANNMKITNKEKTRILTKIANNEPYTINIHSENEPIVVEKKSLAEIIKLNGVKMKDFNDQTVSNEEITKQTIIKLTDWFFSQLSRPESTTSKVINLCKNPTLYDRAIIHVQWIFLRKTTVSNVLSDKVEALWQNEKERGFNLKEMDTSYFVPWLFYKDKDHSLSSITHDDKRSFDNVKQYFLSGAINVAIGHDEEIFTPFKNFQKEMQYPLKDFTQCINTQKEAMWSLLYILVSKNIVSIEDMIFDVFNINHRPNNTIEYTLERISPRFVTPFTIPFKSGYDYIHENTQSSTYRNMQIKQREEKEKYNPDLYLLVNNNFSVKWANIEVLFDHVTTVEPI